jgi:hypothetical protein
MDPQEFWEGMNGYLYQRPILLTDDEKRNPLIAIENICSRDTLFSQRKVLFELLHIAEQFTKLGVQEKFSRNNTTIDVIRLLEACHRFKDLRRAGRVEYSINP